MSVFDALGKIPTGSNVHVQRWYRHIASFSAQEKSGFGGSPAPQAVGGKPTTAADDGTYYEYINSIQIII